MSDFDRTQYRSDILEHMPIPRVEAVAYLLDALINEAELRHRAQHTPNRNTLALERIARTALNVYLVLIAMLVLIAAGVGCLITIASTP